VVDTPWRAIFLVGFVLGSLIRWYYARGHRRTRPARRFSGAVDTVLVLLAGVGLMLPVLYLPTHWLEFADYRLPPWADLTGGLLGTLSFAAGLWVFWRAHAELGRNWAPSLTIQPNQALVTGGVYRRVRHPMYAAHALWAVAQALLLRNWLVGPAFLIAFVPFYLVRVPREERMMIEQFGERYRAYMRRTDRLVPSPGRRSTKEDD